MVFDGTFKVVKAPYTQFLTIHAFIKQGDVEKQVPFAFFLMSSRQKVDYIDVLTSVKNVTGDNSLEEIMIDFELAMWGAIRCVFPEVNIKGCTFHWTQSFWKKIQELGLAPAYFNDEGSQIYLRKLMSLPFLSPRGHPNCVSESCS